MTVRTCDGGIEMFLINKLVSNIIWAIDLRVAKWKSYRLRRLEYKVNKKRTIAHL